MTSHNQLAEATSPYLLQHRDNPVHWRLWGDAALAEARAEDKPILLSVGYAACHWCHVMAHESFENPDIARLMNELFVPVKVDREERPDLDLIYQSALQLLGEHGGWPLTMFLTPAAEPYWGGTYFPPEARLGRPGFADVLRRMAAAYRQDREAVTKNTTALRDGLRRLAAATPGGAVTAAQTTAVARFLTRQVDPFSGGIGDAPKFPQASAFELIWRAWLDTGLEPYRAAVTRTLRHMCQGGIYDHLGGGFSRYSVDADWLVPHFEKMLYDNAQLLDLLTLVWQGTREPLFRERIEETAGWMRREMTTAEGAFASSLDADSEGEEGRFYVWDAAEVDAVLGAEAALFREVYDVTPGGNWEGRTILNRLGALERLDDAREARLAAARAALLARRERRVRPGRDDKVLADWNGLAIAALARAGMVLDRADWIDAAAGAYRFVRTAMTESGRLRHCWRAGRAAHPATIDDHANLARAALALAEARADDAFIDDAAALVALADTHYWDGDAGGYFLTADDTGDVITRTKTATDSPVPAGNGTMVEVLARLGLLTGDDRHVRRAERVVAAFSGDIRARGVPMPTLLCGNALLLDPLQIVVVGPAGDPATNALLSVVHRRSLPGRVLQLAPAPEALPAAHPAAGRPASGGPTAYVCRGRSCSLPITGPAALEESLAAAFPRA